MNVSFSISFYPGERRENFLKHAIFNRNKLKCKFGEEKIETCSKKCKCEAITEMKAGKLLIPYFAIMKIGWGGMRGRKD